MKWDVFSIALKVLFSKRPPLQPPLQKPFLVMQLGLQWAGELWVTYILAGKGEQKAMEETEERTHTVSLYTETSFFGENQAKTQRGAEWVSVGFCWPDTTALLWNKR